MRRWLIALATALVAGALWVGAAYADAGPHGKFNDATGAGATTYRCSSCHRAHTAQGSELVKSASTYLLCTSCHGQTSGLDALDGVDWDTTPTTPGGTGVIGGGSKAAGFINSFMNTSLSLTAPTGLSPSTSAHRVAGMPLAGGGTSTGTYTAWGIGAMGTATGAGNSVTITCGTCHDPHGGSGGVDPATNLRIPTYRILRADIASKLPGSGAGAPVVVPEDTGTHVYTVADVALPTTTYWPAGSVAPEAYYGQSYPTATMTKLNDWCATCHTRIHTAGSTSDPATNPSVDSIYKYRHVTTGTSVEINLGTTSYIPGGFPGCVSCHTSHGSTAKNFRIRNGAPSQLTIEQPGEDPATGPYLDSALLRLDLRGVCEVCHNK